MNIYVGNLPYEVTDDDLRQAFEQFGEVSSVNIITDKYTGKARGFAFVEMPDDGQGEAAVAEWNEKEFGGRTLKVSKARPRADRGDSGGYGGGGGRDRY